VQRLCKTQLRLLMTRLPRKHPMKRIDRLVRRKLVQARFREQDKQRLSGDTRTASRSESS
jgi:hypothetical protein